MEDPVKVQIKLNELNNDASGTSLIRPRWIAIDGYYSLFKTDLNRDQATFHADHGLPLKVFLDTEKGEVKFFPAKSFERDE